jgi:hypothetical protein
VTAVVLALCAAGLWGAGDFLGGVASRRVSVLVVLFWSQFSGLLGLVVRVLLSGGGPCCASGSARSEPAG